MEAPSNDSVCDHDERERVRSQLRDDNEQYLAAFEWWLKSKHLTGTTIRQHIFNVRFYLNSYLLAEGMHTMREGCSRALLDGFFSDFYVRKCAWSSPAAIRQTIAGLRKFYQCMLGLYEVTEEDYRELVRTIKEHKQEWLDFGERYEDPIVRRYELSGFELPQ